MTKDYETIIEHILEAKDTGTSLASLLEKHPEQKGEYFDAWKFVESVDDHMCHDILPTKESFRLFLDSIPEQKPILSQWMQYVSVAIPTLVVIVLVFGYSSKNPNNENIGYNTQTLDSSLLVAVNEENSSFPSQQESNLTNEMLAKKSTLSTASSPSINISMDESFNELESTFSQDSLTETSSSITFANTNTYNDLSTIYD